MSTLLKLLLGAIASTSVTAAQVTVKLDDATVIGTRNGTVTQFLGIPFAQPPVGKLRLQLPQPIPRFSGTINATTFGNQCIQQSVPPPDIPPGLPAAISTFLGIGKPNHDSIPAIPQSEDCLNINVIVPAGTKPGDKLPIAAWIYGGGYQVGSNAVQPGAVVVNRSIELGQPIIFVAMNYRLSAFGFLGGQEIQKAGLGNLGLQDQREALRWVQKHISAFGGDPTKVTIWGESAGSQSVAFQMVTNGGHTEGLFRAGWMESGSALPSGDFSKLQPTFDFIASETGCASANDVLECLRQAPVDAITAAMNRTPTFLGFQALNTPFMPHADGVFLRDNPQKLVLEGSVADVPFVIGSNEDEGTLFTLASLNLTTEQELTAYLKGNYFPNASDATIARLLELYPADPAAGSPFGTGDNFTFTPVYKRLAAFQGDFIFQATRRFLLDQRSGKQVARSFLSERNKVTGLGAAHSTELAIIFGGQDMTDFLVRFVNTLDPNGGPEIHWPAYTSESPQLLAFVDGAKPLEVIPDTFRKDAMDFVTQLGLAQPI
ncbi:carotenoid ester lipase precursor [Trametes versicolor FP-101664 SS1]|uniref:carotenoid ester lipase precursor n=1 Tax=Trametes versicolor (strain FP-101664) TaxID=717944 RepID=UPI00046214F4|nr:carotenoid ester lipase precursor [Trametes versicolor FP-101664 SS1]EIW58887.1 carotenoid ester lipase precursor [Trametes versicolor FP-101664 SS1]